MTSSLPTRDGAFYQLWKATMALGLGYNLWPIFKFFILIPRGQRNPKKKNPLPPLFYL